MTLTRIITLFMMHRVNYDVYYYGSLMVIFHCDEYIIIRMPVSELNEGINRTSWELNR